MISYFFFCLNSHIVGITNSTMHKCFNMSTHMPKSKSQETCQVCFSCTKTFYPPAAHSSPNRNTFSNHFKYYFLMCSTWEGFQIMHWFQWPVSLTQSQSSTPDDINFSLVALAPSIVEDVYATTVTEDINMIDVSPLLCQWSSLMITDRLCFPLPTHWKLTSGISSCNPWACH